MKIPLIYNWRNLVQRPLTTTFTVLGIGLVVFVFAAVLMLANGLRKTLVGTGDKNNVIFLRKGADAEVSSGIPREQANIIRTLPEALLMEDGKPLVAGEVVVLNNLPKRADSEPSNVVVRGVSQESLTLRSKVRLIAGRMWQPGTAEIIAGKGVTKRFKGCGLGETVRMGMRDWKVVGVFEAEGSGFESELWGDVDQFMAAFRRPVFSSITMKLKDPTKFEEMKTRLESDPRLTLDIKREQDYYEEQSQFLGLFIKILGLTVTIIFSFGAMTGAVITMYSAVANRATEIGTLRALGFKRRNILTSFLAECVLLSILGGLLGIIFASFLQFINISTTNWTSFSELVFGFKLSAGIVLGSLIFAVIMGLIGGMSPAIRAARMKVVNALRASY
jgi:ABC-type lipoprotein release transport system permease subunit